MDTAFAGLPDLKPGGKNSAAKTHNAGSPDFFPERGWAGLFPVPDWIKVLPLVKAIRLDHDAAPFDPGGMADGVIGDRCHGTRSRGVHVVVAVLPETSQLLAFEDFLARNDHRFGFLP